MLMFVHPAFLGSLLIVGAFTYAGLSFNQAKKDTDKKNKSIGLGSGSLILGILLCIAMIYYLKHQ